MSETYKFIGRVVHIGEEQTFGSGFNKIGFVLNDGADKYPQEVQFEAVKERVADVQKLQKGDEVSANFDLRGREWEGRYFVNLNAWKIEKIGGAPAQAAPNVDDPLDEEPPF